MNDEQSIESLIEALLFVSGEAIAIQKLSDICRREKEVVTQAIENLRERLSTTGLRILQKEDLVSLVTAPIATPIIEEFIKEELIGEISRTALETLTIIVYKHPISRSEIDYIRGVNSSFTIRNLIIRGLVERIEQTKHTSTVSTRGYLYRPTIECMKFLGITSFAELPEYALFSEELSQGLTQSHDATPSQN